MNNDYMTITVNNVNTDFHEIREDDSQDWADLFSGLAC